MAVLDGLCRADGAPKARRRSDPLSLEPATNLFGYLPYALTSYSGAAGRVRTAGSANSCGYLPVPAIQCRPTGRWRMEHHACAAGVWNLLVAAPRAADSRKKRSQGDAVPLGG